MTGGGTGGHFYPIIAVAESIRELTKKYKLVGVELFYMSSHPYNSGTLFEHDITFIGTSAGKMRRYFSILNFFDIFRTFFGVIKSVWQLFSIYPDVVFGKGGYASFPALMAARILGIPVVIHESDTVPGRTNMWAGKFAKRVAVSYPETARYFKPEKVVFTGQPVRKDIAHPLKTGAKEFLRLEDAAPVLLVLGGSLGAKAINDCILSALPELVEKYQIIHQTGKSNFEEAKMTADSMLLTSAFKDRYKPFGYLNTLSMRMSAGAADLVITRAGSALFEVAAWGKPSIVVPLRESNGDHQIKNAYAYARTGAAMVMEEKNLTAHLLISEIDRIMEDKQIAEEMSQATAKFFDIRSADKIAEEVVKIAITHGKGRRQKKSKKESVPATEEAAAPTQSSEENARDLTLIAQESADNTVMEDSIAGEENTTK